MSDADRAKRLMEELSRERGKGLMIRWLIVLGVLGCFGVFAVNIYSKITSFEEEQLLVHLQDQAATRIWPMVSQEMDELSRKAVPALVGAFQQEAINLLPKLEEKLLSESGIFQKNLASQMQVSLDKAFLDALSQHDAEIRAKLPELSKDSELYDDLLRRLRKSGQDWAQEQLDTTFARHLEVLQSINETVRTLKVQASQEAEGQEAKTADDVLLLFTEIINTRLAGEE